MQKNCLEFPVEFVRDVFGEDATLSKVLAEASGSESPRVFIVADMNVVQRNEGLGSKIGKYVSEHGIQLADRPVVIAGGERIKSDGLASVQKVMSAMVSAKLGKRDIVLAIGGGTLLDVAGYAAAQVRGGIKIVRIPTTPAAMFGAAYADFAAIDIGSVKDAVRAASVPSAVIIDVSMAASVLDGVWRGGIGEAVRVALATDAALMKKLVKGVGDYVARDIETLDEFVRAVHAVRAKKPIPELSLWAPLRLEAMSGYKLPHGYAIPIGIYLDVGYSTEKGILKEKDKDMVVEMLTACGALDGLKHSQHLLTQVDNLLLGLDARALFNGSEAVPVPVGIGKTELEESPDREIFMKVAKDIVARSCAQ